MKMYYFAWISQGAADPCMNRGPISNNSSEWVVGYSREEVYLQLSKAMKEEVDLPIYWDILEVEV